MNKWLTCGILMILASSTAEAQRKVLGYPFQFEKSFLARGAYSTYFLNNPDDSAFALILKDNKKAEYVWLSKSFKVIGKVPTPIEKTTLGEGTHHYIGGTAKGSEYHFIYQVKSGFSMETVDFSGGAISNKKILELPDDEKLLVSLCDHNSFYALAADNKVGALVLHRVGHDGTVSQQSFSFAIPESAHKHKLSEYLGGMKVIKGDEDPELSVAINSVKVFSRPDDLTIVVNNGDDPTQLFSIDLRNQTAKQKTVDYSALISRDDRGKVYISSFLKNDHLFSLILNKKSIRIAIHDVNDGRLLNKYELTDDAGLDLLAEQPITEKRMGKDVQAKDIDDLKKVIRALTKGTEGLMVSQADPSAKIVLTAGTYDQIKMSTGGGTIGGGWQGGWNSPVDTKGIANGANANIPSYNPYMYYRPGIPSYTFTSARYYQTTYFRMLLDPTSLKVTRGQVRRPVVEQIKDFIDDTDKRGRATNQFAIGKNQYYGYYDKDEQQYVIEQIRIF